MNRRIKNFTLIISFLFISIGSFAQESEIYNKLSEIDGVNAVYISSSMLGQIKIPEVNIKSDDVSLKAMYILSSTNKKNASAFRKVIEELKENGEYKVAMKVKEKSDDTTFLIKKNKKGTIKEFIMITEDKEGYKIIQIIGKLNMKSLNLTSK